jgi:hypothetical protein
MSFGRTRLSEAWSEKSPRRIGRSLPDQIWKKIPEPKNIAEIGLDGDLAKRLLQYWPNASYRGFDVNEKIVQQQSLVALAPFRGRAFAARIDGSCELPLPNQSQDFLICSQILEFLRMDQFYMHCSEARRVIRAGGHWLLACTEKEKGLAGLWQKYFSSERQMDLNHFISPEDWEILCEEKSGGLQILLLRRLAS